MNPLALAKYARRGLFCLLAFLGLFLMMGCGSGSGVIPPLGGGFSNSSLKGQYVISQTGIGINQAGTSSDPFTETIIFTADGSGKLNVVVDDFNQDGQQLTPTLPVSGTYNIRNDGTGSLVINYSTSSTYGITMIDDGHFYAVEQDTYATASGYGELQDPTVISAIPSGNFVFKSHTLNTSARVGDITITNGAIAGTEDYLTLGVLATNQAITSSVSMTTPSVNGVGTFTLNDGSKFNYYVVSVAKFRIMSGTGLLEIGQAETQSAGPFSLATLANGSSYVFGSAGDTAISGAAGIHSAGVFTTDGNGNFTGGAVDYVQDTTVNQDLSVTGGTYTLAATGRGTTNLTLSGGVIAPQIFWMVSTTRAYFLVNSTLAVEDGTFTIQTGGPFSALSNKGAFFMDGFDTAFKDRVGLFKPTTTGAFNWNQAANSYDVRLGGTPSALGTNGTYQISSNGRAAVSVNGVTGNLVFYLSSPNTGFIVQEDADIGGAFTQQANQ